MNTIKKDELKNKLYALLQESQAIDDTEKAMWNDILQKVSVHLESVLNEIKDNDINTSASMKPHKKFVHCGFSGVLEKELGKGLHYVSVTDDISYKDDVILTIENDNPKSRFRRDGKWFVIGMGYLYCEYEDLFSLCGRNISYIGVCSDGNFEYSLVLKTEILQQEKLLNRISAENGFEIMPSYAPLLRRLVYIETLQEPTGQIDLQLSQNGLEKLITGWRSVWNIEIPSSEILYSIENNGRHRFRLSDNEYMTVQDSSADIVSCGKGIDNESGQRYFDVYTRNGKKPKDGLLKIIIHDFEPDSYRFSSSIKLFPSPTVDLDELPGRIYSRADLTTCLQRFGGFLEYSDVSTDFPDGLRVCSYETGFEYPTENDHFVFSGRPVLYVVFKADNKPFLFDRIVYVTYLMQRRYPEYLWKGGFIYD